jgi:tyrosinase
MDVFTRRAVSTLDRSRGSPPELVDYANGFRAMTALEPENPLSLVYQAAIHGFDGEPDSENPDWDRCQHESWFFLPWHRMYLRQFEKIIGHLIGKPQWRLPYWDYTSDDESTWELPPEFTAPANPEVNPLFVGGRINTKLDKGHRDYRAALDARAFTGDGPGAISFGSGRIDKPQQFGNAHTGQLENLPHNVVHRVIGGLMGNPFTAAFEPIFWLHHANIDRLWQVWLAQRDRTNPIEKAWLDTSFDFPDPSSRLPMKVRDVLDPESLGYNYDDTTPPAPVDEAAVIVPRDVPESLVEEAREPELIGATSESVALDPGSTHAVGLERPNNWKLAAETRALLPAEAAVDEQALVELALGRQVILELERVTGTQVAVGVYGVYVNVPEGEDPAGHPGLRAGLFSTFGLEVATRKSGNGMTQAFDITPIARRLYDEGRWNPEHLRVTFEAEVPTGTAEVSQDVNAGSIRVYIA